MRKYDIYKNKLKDEYRAVAIAKERIIYRVGLVLCFLVIIVGICVNLPYLFHLISLRSFGTKELLRILVGIFVMLTIIPPMYKRTGFKEKFLLKKQGYEKIGKIEAKTSSEDEAVRIYLEKSGKMTKV